MDKIRIVAAVLDTAMLTLYKEDGRTIEIRQGDTRVQRIIDEVTEPLSTLGYAEVSLALTDPESNVYREFEQLAAGVIRFFRVHKDELSTLFEQIVEKAADNGAYGTDKHLVPVTLGQVPVPADGSAATVVPPAEAASENIQSESDKDHTQAPVASDIRDATTNQRPWMEEAIRQIMATAQPVTDENFSAQDTKEHETMIATVADATTGKPTIVPGMEHLQAQFANAAKLGSTAGVTRFLQRIAAVIGERKHTIDELLNFMSRGDLPIADDGSIVAYKVLQSTTPKGYFVDCHSKQVKQRVGSFVSQAKVDDSRRTECSTGLHIARRAYLHGFPGDSIVLVKIAPEDVIAVPLNEPNKMRARGYHILSEVPATEHSTLRSNKAMEGTEAKKLLGMALKGDHIGVIEDVEIGGPKGAGVVVTQRSAEVNKAPKPKKASPVAEPIEADPDVAKKKAPTVDAKTVGDKVVAAKTENRFEKATRLRDAAYSKAPFAERKQAAIDLFAHKKAAKIGWDKLGISAAELAGIEHLLTAEEPAAKVKDTTKSETNKTHAESAAHLLRAAGEPKKKTVTETKVEKPVATSAEPSRAERAAHLLRTMENGKTKAVRQEAYAALVALKKASKVGWDKLGVEDFPSLQSKFEGK